MNNKMAEKYKGIIHDGKGVLVITIINVIVFIAINTVPNLAQNLLLSPEISLVLERPWTLITVFFSHQLLFHIFLNIALLIVFGLELEKITSSKFLYSIYFLGGFIGSLVILPVAVFIETEDLIAGASAAVFAVVITYAVMRPDALILRSKAKWWALSLVIFNVIIVLLDPRTSDGAAAHLAGIVVGLIVGYWMKNKKIKKPK